MVPPRQVGRLRAVLAWSERERGDVPRRDVCIDQPDLFRVAVVQRRGRRDVELDQSAVDEEQLDESRRRRRMF